MKREVPHIRVLTRSLIVVVLILGSFSLYSAPATAQSESGPSKPVPEAPPAAATPDESSKFKPPERPAKEDVRKDTPGKSLQGLHLDALVADHLQ